MQNETTRERLLALQAEISGVTDMSEAASKPVTLDQTSVGRLSRMDAMQGQAMAQATHARRAEQLRATQAALVRLDNDEYGLCLECDEEIDPKRLDVNPAAALCIRCAESRY